MGRETKVGLVVAASFLSLVGGVMGVKHLQNRPSETPTPDPTPVVAAATPPKAAGPAGELQPPPKLIPADLLVLPAPSAAPSAEPPLTLPTPPTVVRNDPPAARLDDPNANDTLDPPVIKRVRADVGPAAAPPPPGAPVITLPPPAEAPKAGVPAAPPPLPTAGMIELAPLPAPADAKPLTPKHGEPKPMQPTDVPPTVQLGRLTVPLPPEKPKDPMPASGEPKPMTTIDLAPLTAPSTPEKPKDPKPAADEAKVPPLKIELAPPMPPKTGDGPPKPGADLPKPPAAAPIEQPKPELARLGPVPPNDLTTRPGAGPMPPADPTPTPSSARPLDNEPEADVKSYVEEWHYCKQGETLDAISQKYFFTPKYEQALRDYNLDRNPAKIFQQDRPSFPAGQVVKVPPARVLERLYPAKTGGASPVVPTRSGAAASPTSLGPAATLGAAAGGEMGAAREYFVPRADMTLRDVAKEELGSDAHWHRIFLLNRWVNPSAPLPQGTKLYIPRPPAQ